MPFYTHSSLPCGSVVKILPASAGDVGSIPGSGRSPGEGNGNPSNILAWKSHRQRNLVGYSPWGHKRVGYDLAKQYTYITHYIWYILSIYHTNQRQKKKQPGLKPVWLQIGSVTN